MASFINTNIASLNAQRNLSVSQNSLHTSLQRLSSGLRVNSAKDDAAGLAIAAGLESQYRGMNQAIRNANDGISLAQTAEGGLATIAQNLQRMRELAVQGSNATNQGTSSTPINAEFVALRDENLRIANATSFNSVGVLNAATALTFQVGSGATAGTDSIVVTTVNVSGLGTAAATIASANIAALDTDISTVANARGTWGAAQATFDSVVTNLQISSENSTAARSRIMDTDFGAETANLSRAQILQQAGTAMLAQANQSPNTVLALLR